MYLQKEISNKNKKKINFLLASLKATAKKSKIRVRNPEYGSKDPVLDPYQNVRDPERWNFKFLVFLFL
jgi:hypothetical protein